MAHYSLTLEDSKGRTMKKLIGVEEQGTLALYTSVATAFVTALQAVTDMALISIDLVVDNIVDGFAVTAGANRDVGGTFVGWLADPVGIKAVAKIPHPKAALIDDDGSISITGVVATYLNQFLTAGDLTISRGRTIDSWIKGTLDK